MTITVPMFGALDAFALVALGFVIVILGVTAAVFGWLNAQMKKPPGAR